MTTVDVQNIDAALARLPATPKTDKDLDARAALMARRIELDQAARITSAASSQRQQRGNLVVNVPAAVGTTHHYSGRGRVSQSRVTEDGRVVLDLFPEEFRTLLADRRFGHDWHNSNPEAVQALGQA
jgi:hypothetical protein